MFGRLAPCLVVVVAVVVATAACGGQAVHAARTKTPGRDVVTPQSVYNPLDIPDSAQSITTIDLVVRDEARDREIPVRVYLPAQKTPAPLVVFSHGLGGSRESNVFLGRHWAARGFVAAFLQHPGSDEAVWKTAAPGDRMRAMKAAATLENALLRFADVPRVLSALTRWSEDASSQLSGRIDPKHIGMSGHSFGAVTTQAVSGERSPGEGRSFTDARIGAAIIMSPQSSKQSSPEHSFGGVRIPWLLMTASHDVAAVGDVDVPARRAVFPALPPGGKYELVLAGGEHMAFSDFPTLPGQPAKNPNHHRVLLALTTAFWDAYLRNDAAARAWLDGEGPRGVLQADDLWQRK